MVSIYTEVILFLFLVIKGINVLTLITFRIIGEIQTAMSISQRGVITGISQTKLNP